LPACGPAETPTFVRIPLRHFWLFGGRFQALVNADNPVLDNIPYCDTIIAI